MGQNKKRITPSALEDRFEKLIQERINPESDEKKVDKKIWDLFGEDWCIMFTDLCGFSKNSQKFGILHSIQVIYESQRLLFQIIERYEGILLKTMGDGFLIIFRNVNKAVQCAIDMQNTLKKYNKSKIDEEDILLRVGIGYGHVLKIGDQDVYGVEVNEACNVQSDHAKVYEICLTESAKNQLGESKDFSLEKNFDPEDGLTFFKVIYEKP